MSRNRLWRFAHLVDQGDALTDQEREWKANLERWAADAFRKILDGAAPADALELPAGKPRSKVTLFEKLKAARRVAELSRVLGSRDEAVARVAAEIHKSPRTVERYHDEYIGLAREVDKL